MSKTTAILDKEIVLALTNYIETQEKLLVEFEKQYHSLSNDANLLKKPKTGILSTLGEEWKFQKHGAGIFFEESRTGKIIDAHRAITNNQRAFDSWRLSEYFESVNCSRIMWRSNAFVADDDDELDKLLELLEQAAIVQLISSQYKLYELIK